MKRLAWLAEQAKLTELKTFQWAATLGSLLASLLAISWTLCRWGVTTALSEVAPLLVTLTCLAVGLAALTVLAWVVHRWGAIPALYGVAPLFILAACTGGLLAALGSVSQTLQTCGFTGTLWSSTCLVVLLVHLGKASSCCWQYLRPGLAWPRRAVHTLTKEASDHDRQVAKDFVQGYPGSGMTDALILGTNR